MGMSQLFRPARRLRPAPNPLDKLREAGADFVARWQAGPARRDGALRHVEAGLTLIFFVALFGVAYLWDESGARWATGLPPGPVGVFQVITRLGLSGYIFALSALVAVAAILARGRGAGARADATLGLLAGRATFVFATALASGLFSQVIKHLFGRARPQLMSLVGPFHFDTFALSARYGSFPSGHTVTAFAVAAALGFFAPRWRWPLIALACLVAVSRVGVGAHYPSDVLAGAALGIGTTLLLRRMFGLRRIVFRPRGRGFATRRGAPIAAAFLRIPLGWR
jgi:undecaprenyl-diphosphatase